MAVRSPGLDDALAEYVDHLAVERGLSEHTVAAYRRDLTRYVAYLGAAADASRELAEPVPLHLRNAPTRLMKELDYGKGYQYAHDERDAVTGMDCLPPSLAGRKYYEPTERGFEREIKRRLDAWAVRKRARRDGTP